MTGTCATFRAAIRHHLERLLDERATGGARR